MLEAFDVYFCLMSVGFRWSEQGVHEIFEGSPDRLWGKDETRTNKIVFIGKNLNREELEMGFRACLV